MSICPECGYQSDSAKFCGKCGAKMAPQQTAVVESAPPAEQQAEYDAPSSAPQPAEGGGRRVVRPYAEREPEREEADSPEPLLRADSGAHSLPPAADPEPFRRQPEPNVPEPAEGYGHEDLSAAYYPPSRRKLQPWVIVVLALSAAALILLPLVLEVVLSFSRVSGNRLSDLKFMGFRNYSMLFRSYMFKELFQYSALLRLIEIAPGLLVGGILAMIIGRAVKSPSRRAAVGCAALALAFVPSIAWFNLFAKPLGVTVGYTWSAEFSLSRAIGQMPAFYLMFALATFFPTFGLTVFAGLMWSCARGRAQGAGVMKGIAVLALLMIVGGVFSPDDGAVHAARGALAQSNWTSTFSSWIYENGIKKADIAYASAISAFRNLLNAVIAVVPIIMIYRLRRGADSEVTDIRRDSGAVWTRAGIIVIIVAAVVMVAFRLTSFTSMQNGVERLGSLLSSLVTLLLSSLVAYTLIAATGTGRGLLFGVILILFLTLADHVPATYVLFKNMGVLDGFVPEVLLSVLRPRVMTVIVLMGILNGGRTNAKRLVLLAAAAGCFAAAVQWGDYYNSMLYAYLAQNVNAGARLFRISQAAVTFAQGNAEGILTADSQIMREVLNCAIPSLMFGIMGGVLCHTAFRRDADSVI